MPDGSHVYSSARARQFEGFVRNQLKQRGIKQKDLAKEDGVTESNISTFLTGSTHRKCKSFSAIASGLGISDNELEDIKYNANLEFFTPDQQLKQIMRTTKENTGDLDKQELSEQLKAAFAKIADLEEENRVLSENAMEGRLPNGASVFLKNSATQEKTRDFISFFGPKNE